MCPTVGQCVCKERNEGQVAISGRVMLDIHTLLPNKLWYDCVRRFCMGVCSSEELLPFVDGTLFILGGPPRDCSNIVVQILISVEVRLFQ